MASQSQPSLSARANDKEQIPRYTTGLAALLRPQARRLIEEYAKVPPDQVESHVKAIVGATKIDNAPSAVLETNIITANPCLGDFSLTLRRATHMAESLHPLPSFPRPRLVAAEGRRFHYRLRLHDRSRPAAACI